jgi:hypothetical protein
MDGQIIQILGFMLVVAACTANDSLQTLGTFLVSNRGRTAVHLQVTWICLATTLILIVGWLRYGGDPSWGLLSQFPLPGEFTLYYLIPPLTVAALTWWGAPIGTSILVLAAFSPVQTSALITTSIVGGLFALIASATVYGFALWMLERRFIRNIQDCNQLPRRWLILQWFSTAWLWCQWMIQNAASFYVYLPRRLSFIELLISICVICCAIALIFAWGGGPVQKIIYHKANIRDIRSATLCDLVFGTILFARMISFPVIPMSTTWVFLGLLAGRELALVVRLNVSTPLTAFTELSKDFFKAFVGVMVSLGVVSILRLLTRLAA